MRDIIYTLSITHIILGTIQAFFGDSINLTFGMYGVALTLFLFGNISDL